MGRILLVAVLLQPPPDHWFGADKVKHFLLSAMVESVSVSAARSLGMPRGSADAIGAGVTFGVGFGREVHDLRVGKGMSVKDLVWDGVGGVAAASLLNGAR